MGIVESMFAVYVMPKGNPKGKTALKKFGTNNERTPYPGAITSCHAEVDALKSLEWNKHRRLIGIDLWVIRVSWDTKNSDDFTLSESRPCYHCMKYMDNMNRVGYKINNIHYSTGDGTIKSMTFKNFKSLKDHFITSGHLFDSKREPECMIKYSKKDSRRYKRFVTKHKKKLLIKIEDDRYERNRLERFRLSLKYDLDAERYSDESESDSDSKSDRS